MYFKSFYATNIFHTCKRFRALSQGDKIIPIWQVSMAKRFEKDVKKSKIENINTRILGLVF